MSSISDVVYNIILNFITLTVLFAALPFQWMLFFKEVLATITFTKRRYPDPQTIVITGANAGIGRAFALEYAKFGNHLILIARNNEALDRVRADCEMRGATVQTFSLDVANAESLKDQLTTLYDSRPFDLLIANAGIAGKTIEGHGEVPWEELYHRVDNVNYKGMLNTVMPVYQKMKESRNHGQIAIVSSVVGLFGPPNFIWYNSSKAALISIARDLRYWAAKDHIRVNLILPGTIETRLTKQLDAPLIRLGLQSPEHLAKRIRQALVRNVGVITSPTYQWWLVHSASCLPPNIQEWLVWLAGDLKIASSKMT